MQGLNIYQSCVNTTSLGLHDHAYFRKPQDELYDSYYLPTPRGAILASPVIYMNTLIHNTLILIVNHPCNFMKKNL